MPGLRRDPRLGFALGVGLELIEPRDLDAALADLGPAAPIRGLRTGRSRSHRADMARRASALIDAGDVFQENLTLPIRFQYAGDPRAIAPTGAM